jgi:hypothetical protein
VNAPSPEDRSDGVRIDLILHFDRLIAPGGPSEEINADALSPHLQANEGRPGGALPTAKPIARSYSASGIP